ncbi:hypothetical protein Tco_0532744 [Tanacetum coccineum]
MSDRTDSFLKFIEDVITKNIVYHLFDDEVEFLGCVILSYLLALEITCSCFHDFIDKDLIDLVLPDVRRYVVVLTGYLIKGKLGSFVSFREMITSQLQGKLWLYDEYKSTKDNNNQESKGERSRIGLVIDVRSYGGAGITCPGSDTPLVETLVCSSGAEEWVAVVEVPVRVLEQPKYPHRLPEHPQRIQEHPLPLWSRGYPSLCIANPQTVVEPPKLMQINNWKLLGNNRQTPQSLITNEAKVSSKIPNEVASRQPSSTLPPLSMP